MIKRVHIIIVITHLQAFRPHIINLSIQRRSATRVSLSGAQPCTRSADCVCRHTRWQLACVVRRDDSATPPPHKHQLLAADWWSGQPPPPPQLSDTPAVYAAARCGSQNERHTYSRRPLALRQGESQSAQWNPPALDLVIHSITVHLGPLFRNNLTSTLSHLGGVRELETNLGIVWLENRARLRHNSPEC